MQFLSNLWYMGAWADELQEGGLLSRTIADRAIVLWRDEHGEVKAVIDRCPHRFAPLHLGHVDAGGITCGYHGLAFDGAGRCVANPHGPIASSLHIDAFTCAERHGILWLWFGDSNSSDVASIPDLGFIDRAPAHGFSKGYMPTAAAHQLLIDNILDLSHADYLHADTLGGGSISRSKPVVKQLADGALNVRWTALNEAPLPIMRPNLNCDRADMWTDVVWHPNGVMVLTIKATPAGSPAEMGIETVNAHIMTPKTSAETHYFYCNSRNFRTDDEKYNTQRASALRRAFESEDKPMIEAQQRSIGDHDFMSLRPALLPIDAGSVLARRIYARLLDKVND